MNQTITINIGGYPFTIDDNAYEVAEKYLNALARHFSGSDGAQEIMSDIESRMGELIQRQRGIRPIVNKDDVLQVIAILGTPDELKEMNFNETKSETKKESFQIKTGKRLYRDPDDKIIAGVCSGLASYFGIQDPVWIRLAFGLVFLAGGSGVLIYLLIWWIVPKATTVSERLEMMGEPTNVNNIANAVKEQLEELSDKFSDTFQKKSKKHKSYSPPPPPPAMDDFDPPKQAGWSFPTVVKPATGDYNKKDFV